MALTKARNRMIEGAPANVRDFGAVGDGVADDTAAFNAAIATTKQVYIPNGDYALNAVQLTSDVTMVGENNVRTRLIPTGDNVTIFEVAASAATLRLSNFRASEQSSSGGVRYGCTFFNQVDKSYFISHPIFEDIIIDRGFNYGFKGSFIYAQWENCRMGHAGTAGNRFIPILARDDSGSPSAGHIFSICTLRNCWLYGGKTTGVTAEGLAMVNVNNGDVWAFDTCGFESTTNTGAVYSQGTREMRFESCWFEGCATNATLRGDSTGLSGHGALFAIDGCRFSNYAGPTSVVIQLDAASSATLSNSEMVLGAAGLVVQGGGGNVTELSQNTYDSVPSGFKNILDKNQWRRSGTFTTRLSSSGPVPTLDPAFDTLSYTLQGDSCHIQGRIRVNGVASPTGTLIIADLPFTSSTAAETPDVEFSQVGYESLASAVGVGLVGVIEPASTGMWIREQTTTTLSTATAAKMQVGTLLYINTTYKIG
jgi:hypothetical protein